MNKDLDQIVTKLPKKEKIAFKVLCYSQNKNMNEVINELIAKANREWRIANGQETLDDFNEETRKAILNCSDENYVNSLSSYDSVDDLFKSMGIDDKKDNKRK